MIFLLFKISDITQLKTEFEVNWNAKCQKTPLAKLVKAASSLISADIHLVFLIPAEPFLKIGKSANTRFADFLLSEFRVYLRIHCQEN